MKYIVIKLFFDCLFVNLMGVNCIFYYYFCVDITHFYVSLLAELNRFCSVLQMTNLTGYKTDFAEIITDFRFTTSLP